MTRKQARLQNLIVGIFGTTAFITITFFSFTWLNAWRYNQATGSFEQTSIIAVESSIKDVTVWINGLKVADGIPTQQRNLQPGFYDVEIRRSGFHTYQKSFRLQPGTVGLVKDVVMIAEKPLITNLNATYRFVNIGIIGTGLTLTGGELYDGTKFITRFATSPQKIYRLNDSYLYLINKDIRLFVGETSQDFLVDTVESANPLINPNPFSWTVAVKDAKKSYLINLIETNVVAVAPRT